MYCSTCGARNESDALYCNTCGARLEIDDTGASGSSSGTSRLPFDAAVRTTLVALSPNVLREPHKFLSALKDTCEPSSRALTVFEINCDKEVLAPFVEEMDTARWGSFDNAAARAIGVLSGPNGRGVDQSIATEICGTICSALNVIHGLSSDKTVHVVPSDSKRPNGHATVTNRGAYDVHQQDTRPTRPVTPVYDNRYINSGSGNGNGNRVAVAALALLAVTLIAAVVVLLLPKAQSSIEDSAGNGSSESASNQSGTMVDTDSPSDDDTSGDGGGLSAVPDNEYEERAASFPREWQGTFVGYSSDTKSHKVTNGVEMTFTQVRSDGSVEGTCTIIVNRAIADKGSDSYRIKGTIDWDTNAIDVWGYDWIYQGDSEYMRRFSGTYDMAVGRIVGMTEVKETGGRIGDWNMTAI